MPKPTGPSNPELQNLILELRRQGYEKKSKFLLTISKKLSVSSRRRVEVNLAHLERICKENETIIIPGKLLSYGILTKPITVACWNFSKSAKEKIEKSAGSIITIKEMLEKNPTGKNLRIVC